MYPPWMFAGPVFAEGFVRDCDVVVAADFVRDSDVVAGDSCVLPAEKIWTALSSGWGFLEEDLLLLFGSTGLPGVIVTAYWHRLLPGGPSGS